MKDKMKDFSKMVQEPKPSGNDVKCAEIKALPTGISSNGFGEKQKNVFKIGEYNRATATFEMNSTEDSGRNAETKPKFDLSPDTGPCHYFKSLFARSMVVSNTSDRCKSMDHAFTKRKSQKEGSPKRSAENRDSRSNSCRERFWMMPGKENWDLRRAHLAEVRDDEFNSIGNLQCEHPQNNKKSDISEMAEQSSPQSLMCDRPGSRSSSFSYNRFLSSSGADKRFEEARLRSPLTSSCRSSFHRSYSSASDVDSVMLQSQVTTLEWQLRQAEASRQMYRAVMEQVVSFLQKTHKNLDLLQNRLDDNDADDVTRIPRSRSVHVVHGDTSPIRFSSPRSETNLSFQKAKSFVQIGDPDCPKHGSMYKEMSWRRPRKQQRDADEINPSKLSEEAFRLLRTVKSLLNTREPDLTSRLNPASTTCSSPANIADVSSASSTVSATLESDHSDRFQPRENNLGATRGKESPLRGEETRRRPSRDETTPMTATGGVVVAAKGSPPQLSISSADDESGFSSLNSFQEIGGPVSNSTFLKSRPDNTYPEIGLPKVDDSGCKVHRRWSSTPVDSHVTKLRPASLCTNGEAIRVLWV